MAHATETLEMIEFLRGRLDYDPAAGSIKWRITTTRTKAGAEAGAITRDGYRDISISMCGKKRGVKAHRIAWALAYGRWPEKDIDHINGNRLDNRLENLRDISRSHNLQNQQKSHARNKSGAAIPGVWWSEEKLKYRVQGYIDGKRRHVGYFKSIADAEAASLDFRRANYKGNTL
jgi:hypothetical protein